MSLKLSSARNIQSNTSSICRHCRLKYFRRHVSSSPRSSDTTPVSSFQLSSSRGLSPSKTCLKSSITRNTPKTARSYERGLHTSRVWEHPDTAEKANSSSEPPEPPWLDNINVSKHKESNKSWRPDIKPLAFSSVEEKPASASGNARARRKAALSKYKVQRMKDIRADLRKWADDPENQSTPDYPDEKFAATPDHNIRTPDEAIEAQQPLDKHSSDLIDEFDRLEALANDESDQTTLRPRGSLIHLGRTTVSDSMGLILGKSGTFNMLYLPSGKLIMASVASEIHLVRGFASLEELEPLLAHIPEKLPTELTETDMPGYTYCIPREVGAPMLEKMRSFATEVDLEFRRYSTALEEAHEKLSHPTETQVMLLEDIATHVTGKAEHELSEPLLFAVTRFIVSDLGFQAVSIRSAFYRAFIVEPREIVSTIHRVQGWVRAYQEEAALVIGNFTVPEVLTRQSSPLKSFSRKCKVLVQESRKLREYSRLGQPLRAKQEVIQKGEASDGFIDSLEFTDSDRDFIRCLIYGTTGYNRGSTFRSLAPSIIKATNIYDVPNLDISYVHNLLSEIGVLQPWQDYYPADLSIMVRNDELSKWESEVGDQISLGETVEKAANLQDSMAHLRKDWGDLPVFCLDWKATLTIDDGISLEPIPDTPDEYWFHLHIAHPSAFTSPDHPIGKMAYRRLTGSYFAETALPMFPLWFNLNFSIESGSSVLTISTRMDSEANILETKIQPGVIRNFRRVNFNDMNKEMGLEIHTKRPEGNHQWTLSVGNNLTNKDVTAKEVPIRYYMSSPGDQDEPRNFDGERSTQTSTYLKPGERPILEQMLKLADKLSTKYSHSPFRVPTLKRNSSVWNPRYDGLATTRLDSPPDRARFATEDPRMNIPMGPDYLLEKRDEEYVPSSDWMLALKELVFASSYSLAKWADDRNVPLVYLGSGAAMDGINSTGAMQSLRKALFQLNSKEDPLAFKRLKETILGALSTSRASSKPVTDSATGMTHAVSISSPLRKYNDLLNLWQVDAALREEASRGRSLVGETDTSYLPVSRPQMDKIIRHSHFRQRMIEKFNRRHDHHFPTLALARALYLNEGTLPEFFTAFTTPTPFAFIAAEIVEIGAFARFEEGPGEDGNEYNFNEVWQVRLVDVDLFTRNLHVRLVKRLKTAEEYARSALDGLPKFINPEAHPIESHTSVSSEEALSPNSESQHEDDTSSSTSNEPSVAEAASL